MPSCWPVHREVEALLCPRRSSSSSGLLGGGGSQLVTTARPVPACALLCPSRCLALVAYCCPGQGRGDGGAQLVGAPEAGAACIAQHGLACQGQRAGRKGSWSAERLARRRELFEGGEGQR